MLPWQPILTGRLFQNERFLFLIYDNQLSVSKFRVFVSFFCLPFLFDHTLVAVGGFLRFWGNQDIQDDYNFEIEWGGLPHPPPPPLPPHVTGPRRRRKCPVKIRLTDCCTVLLRFVLGRSFHNRRDVFKLHTLLSTHKRFYSLWKHLVWTFSKADRQISVSIIKPICVSSGR